ncbi:hypothetical protein BD289DRAFT_455033 [Coniella lustricola]|uniref:Carboxylesterase type B domain-containing protein n=1 Tax=Coniella lustricola TaxID=2025994 RepID=A0A2T3A189_9PEZI|nr:hypothetical protein BD289DRAFT_455033 [Coniella lustricola]
MDSGSITATQPVNSVKAQEIFDTEVEAAGCTSAADSAKLDCLRRVDYDTFANAANNVPAYLGHTSLAFSYARRPDGRTFTASPGLLAPTEKYAEVSMIIGTQENWLSKPS